VSSRINPKAAQHPSVAAILALAGTQISLGEGRDDHEYEGQDRQRDQWRVLEERRNPAHAEHG
jgi:hypothetical protein